MKIIKKILLIIGISYIIIFMPSCNQKRELTEMAKILAIAVDTAPNGRYLVTVESLKQGTGGETSKAMEGGGGTEGPGETMIFSSTGDSVLDAINNLSGIIGKKVRVSHNKVIIIGEDLAKRGIASVVDFSLRFQEMRPNIPIIVAKGKAYDILNMQTIDIPIVANVIENMMDTQDRLGYALLETNLHFARALGIKEVSPVCGVIKKGIDKATKKEILILEGTAVFKNNKLIGYLNKDETRGLSWILGRVKTGDVVVSYPENTKSTLYILNSHSKVKPRYENGRLVFEINIDERSNLREMTGSLDPLKNLDLIDTLNQKQNEVIKKEILDVVEKAQKEFKADIFDFAIKMSKDLPDEWHSMKKNWEEEFSNCEVRINANSEIRRPGTISKPVY